MNTLLKLKSVIPLFIKKFYWNSRRGIKEYIKTNFIDQAIPCDVRKLTFKIGVSNDLEYFRIHTYEKKEPELLDWLDSSLRKQDTLYDIGANIGLYSLYAAKLVPEAQVYSFEPEANNYTRLCRNILLNNLKNVVPVNVAICENLKFDYLNLSTLTVGAGLHSFGGDTQSMVFAQGMLGTSLDALVFNHHLPMPTLMKLDVDGNEKDILIGAARVLSDDRLREILVEIAEKDGNDVDGISSLLAVHNFKSSRVSAWAVELNGVRYQNHIFKKGS